jgi:Cu-processing system ATP-binding protein
MTDSTILQIDAVSKRFGKKTVVDEVSLRIAAGERVALLGHNGAGKTTLMKMVLGLSRPSGGAIFVLGQAPGSPAARRTSAYLPENIAFNPALSGTETLRFYARLKGADPRQTGSLLDKVGLAEAGRQAVRTYSKGMRQRLGLAQALIGTPRLLLLDEPTSGLDPVSRQMFYDVVAELAGRGTAILLSSHALTEVEARTERVAIMRGGKLLADDRLAALAARAALPIRIRVEARAGQADEVAARLGGARMNGRRVELSCGSGGKLAALRRVAALGDLIEDVDVALPNLDDVYRHYSGGGARHEEES